MLVTPLYYQVISNCINYQPVKLKLHHELRDNNGSTDSLPVSWCTIAKSDNTLLEEIAYEGWLMQRLILWLWAIVILSAYAR